MEQPGTDDEKQKDGLMGGSAESERRRLQVEGFSVVRMLMLCRQNNVECNHKTLPPLPSNFVDVIMPKSRVFISLCQQHMREM